MTSVAISPKFQVVIPKSVREALKLRPGQRMDVRLDASGAVVFEPELDIRSARGLFPGMSSHVPNDPEDATWPGGCEPLHGLSLTPDEPVP
jgi:AbrB family looped-hinge helix DNA binding protein